MKDKLNEIAVRIQATEPAKGLTTIEISNLLRPHNLIGQPIKYTAEQMSIVFEYYRIAIEEINRERKYPPSKENFCAFAGISTVTYNQYLMSADEAKQNVMLMIEDYIKENMFTSAQVGEIKEITTIFRGKTGHGMVEATAPIIVEHRSETDLSKVNSMIEAIKAGKSLKSIELDKKDYKVEDEQC